MCVVLAHSQTFLQMSAMRGWSAAVQRLMMAPAVVDAASSLPVCCKCAACVDFILCGCVWRQLLVCWCVGSLAGRGELCKGFQPSHRH